MRHAIFSFIKNENVQLHHVPQLQNTSTPNPATATLQNFELQTSENILKILGKNKQLEEWNIFAEIELVWQYHYFFPQHQVRPRELPLSFCFSSSQLNLVAHVLELRHRIGTRRIRSKKNRDGNWWKQEPQMPVVVLLFFIVVRSLLELFICYTYLLQR